MNLGKIDMGKLESLAKVRGISAEELRAALAARGLQGVTFMTGGPSPLLPGTSR